MQKPSLDLTDTIELFLLHTWKADILVITPLHSQLVGQGSDVSVLQLNLPSWDH